MSEQNFQPRDYHEIAPLGASAISNDVRTFLGGGFKINHSRSFNAYTINKLKLKNKLMKEFSKKIFGG